MCCTVYGLKARGCWLKGYYTLYTMSYGHISICSCHSAARKLSTRNLQLTTYNLHMKIKTAFEHDQEIPRPYTCLGPNISLPLQFEDLPEGTESLVLIFEDVDATPRPWTHWMVFNIPPSTVKTDEGTIPQGGVEGLANNHSFGYEGPCPRYFHGTHHYWLRLYALDRMLDLPANSERENVEQAMKGHILDQAELLGLCTRPEELE